MCGCLSCTTPQACILTGDLARNPGMWSRLGIESVGDPLVCRLVLSPLSHTTQGQYLYILVFLQSPVLIRVWESYTLLVQMKIHTTFLESNLATCRAQSCHNFGDLDKSIPPQGVYPEKIIRRTDFICIIICSDKLKKNSNFQQWGVG